MRTYSGPMILANWARALALRFMTPPELASSVITDTAYAD